MHFFFFFMLENLSKAGPFVPTPAESKRFAFFFNILSYMHIYSTIELGLRFQKIYIYIQILEE